eukprot:SAG31_NODE_963_length_10710_cov_332.216285_4_plen_120_part_00
MHALDPTVPDMPFNTEIYGHPLGNNKASSGKESKTSLKRSLRIGWFDDDGFATPTPACARAVDVAKNVLEARGHVLVPFPLFKSEGLGSEAFQLFVCLLGADQVLDSPKFIEFSIAKLC